MSYPLYLCLHASHIMTLQQCVCGCVCSQDNEKPLPTLAPATFAELLWHLSYEIQKQPPPSKPHAAHILLL